MTLPRYPRTAFTDSRWIYRWIVADGEVLGGIALRKMLGEARRLGLEQVLVICELENTASARTIERAGGVLAADNGGRVLRYLIST